MYLKTAYAMYNIYKLHERRFLFHLLTYSGQGQNAAVRLQLVQEGKGEAVQTLRCLLDLEPIQLGVFFVEVTKQRLGA